MILLNDGWVVDLAMELGILPHNFSNLFGTPEIPGSVLWQYSLWSFKSQYTKLERFLPKNQLKLLNFKNWCNEEVTKGAKI